MKTRLRRILIPVGILTVIVLLTLAFLVSRGYLRRVSYQKEISAEKALSICPFVRITAEEYDFIQQLLLDEDINSFFTETAEEGSLLTDYEVKQIEEDVLARYEGILTINGTSAVICDSMITDYGYIWIGYQSGSSRCYLEFSAKETVQKSCAEYKNNDAVYVVHNKNNQEFSILTEGPLTFVG